MRNVRWFLSGWIWFVMASSAWAGALPEAVPADVGMSSARLDRLTAALQRAVDSGELPGAVALVARKGRLVYQKSFGMQDKTLGIPMANDSIFRIYSMTKPIVSVAAMILYEEGRLAMYEPLSKYLPEFKDMRVGIESRDPVTGAPTFDTVPARRQITIQDLMRHTSGLTYGGLGGRSAVKDLYREAGLASQSWTTERFAGAIARLPLVFEPGTTWEYGHSTDVLGRVVEVVAGKPLDVFLAERILGPLAMRDTGFHVPPEKLQRLAQPQPDPKTGEVPELIDVTKPATFFAGGHGLVSTPGDYLRFCQMLLNGGELAGVRILGRKTVEYMTADHLTPAIAPGPAYLPGPGYGFGLGFAVRREAGMSEWPGSVGEFFWGGYAGTAFWIDPKEQLVPVLMFQDPARRVHYRVLFRNLVTQALVD